MATKVPKGLSSFIRARMFDDKESTLPYLRWLTSKPEDVSADRYHREKASKW